MRPCPFTVMDILWGKKGNSPSVLRQEKCHKKISQRQAENTTDKTNVGPHVASGAIHHAASCEKIRHAMRSRKKNVFAEGNSPPSVRQLGTQAAPTKSRKNTRSKKLSFLCQKKRSKTTKNHLSFSTRCNRRVPKVCTLRQHAFSFALGFTVIILSENPQKSIFRCFVLPRAEG